MAKIDSAKILILATDGYERSELRVPLEELTQRGAEVKIASLKPGEIRSWDEKDWGDSVKVDIEATRVDPRDFDALVLPGGQINPDVLRKDQAAVDLVRQFVASGKPVAAICHGPWLLVEADALRGRQATSYPSIRTDLRNAGASWKDEAVVVDNGIITSRSPKDLAQFVGKIVEEVEEGRHQRRAA
ncbi:type 1 glutamine amidotransferase domain-containing protein [Neorhizobium sp. NCHU2750]|uniref:type 1 glutamine amidotransferase domain-containing protein n=1 Tax=Neorhizobium sp. NCHU2750 TaxID=1825976 RepID=UPI000E75761B|nr:protease I [Neorhizobium sp. NCHU2750]